MSRIALSGLLMAVSIYAAHAFGLGREGLGFGKLGVANLRGSGPIAGCALPDAPDGVVDLSKCSNAFYIAVIF